MTSLSLIQKTAVLVLFFLLPFAAGRAPGEALAAAALQQTKAPLVEVMFVLDTTGSMSGLIEAAKTKIWSIANTLASSDPAPEIRMGLVGYRDRGDAYVTMLTGLSHDLDSVYADLMQFRAGGGGDTPESVNQALYEAVTHTPWSTPGQRAYRVIFLVGDAPPHMDYQDDIRYAESCRLARSKGIVINSIQCGDSNETTPFWKKIADLGNGDFFHVAQSGGAVLYDTPYDTKIAQLSEALDDTRIFYGSHRELAEMEARRKTADEIYADAKPAAVAQRTVFNAGEAGARNFIGSRELVHDVTSGRVRVDALEPEMLPPELQHMKTDDLKRLITERGQKRSHLQKRIQALAAERQQYIQAKVEKESDAGVDSLDSKLFMCIQRQAKAAGLAYEGGPVY